MRQLHIIQILVLISSMFLFGNCSKIVSKSYKIEAVNDSLIFKYPNPKPVHVVAQSFNVNEVDYTKHIPINSKNLHNISVCIENTSDVLIEDPYLFSSWEYDFRDLSALVGKIVEGVTSPEEKFLRVHEWFTYHYDRFQAKNGDEEYDWEDYQGNPIRLINQYGGSMCGEAVQATGGLTLFIPPAGSFYCRKINMTRHQTGEVWYDGSWHNFDASPEIRWLYYGYNNDSLIADWSELRDNSELIKRIKTLTGWDILNYVDSASCTIAENICDAGRQWDFRYNLRPSEKITMFFDMQGRTDQKSRRYEPYFLNIQSPEERRNPCDYASAVFTYRPDFKTIIHQEYAIREFNIKWTNKGIVPLDPEKLSHIIYPVKSTWLMVGADIKADFITDGEVYIARKPEIEDIAYSDNMDWQLLSSDKLEYDSTSIEGRLAYWVKFEFRGEGSGLKSAEIATEVQMNKYAMPALRYGDNFIRFSAEDMNSGSAKVTYKYDDKSKYDFYEPATSDYGRHIVYRVGGNHIKPWIKPLFYRNIKNDSEGGLPIKVEIFSVSGENSGKKVRTLKNEHMKYGTYWWYWDGKDDDAKKCPRGMYNYKVTGGEIGEGDYNISNEFGERLYLFDRIWPEPNEVRPDEPTDSLLAQLSVIEKDAPGGYNPMIHMEFPKIPGSATESWCYETPGLEFISYKKTAGGGLELRHQYKGGTVVTEVIPFREKVKFVAHVEGQTSKPPMLNMCWQLREAPNFKAIDEDHYSELIDREFIFMKDSGRVFLNHTVRRPKVGTDLSEWFNTPYPWTQIYKPVWDVQKNDEIDLNDCEGWSNCSPDRYNKTVIGAVSIDGKWLVALAADSSAMSLCNAWHDCMHIWSKWEGGIWRNTVYAMENNPDRLLEKYNEDF